MNDWIQKNHPGLDWDMISFYLPGIENEGIPATHFGGMIGMLFPSFKLKALSEYLNDNFDDEPVDWLIGIFSFLRLKIC